MRTRTHAVALRLEATDRQMAAAVVPAQDGPGKATAADARRPIVMLDGAYVRAVRGHRTRNFEVIRGKVEREGHASRRFALVRSVAEPPDVPLRAALLDQGWREGGPVTAISDGDLALPALVRLAAKAPVEPILDWFHLSMRVPHVEQGERIAGLVDWAPFGRLLAPLRVPSGRPGKANMPAGLVDWSRSYPRIRWIGRGFSADRSRGDSVDQSQIFGGSVARNRPKSMNYKANPEL